MDAISDPIAFERQWLLREGVVLAAVAALGTALFWFTSLDIATVRPFFHPGAPDPWPMAGQWLFRVCYLSAPWLTGGLALAGSALLVSGCACMASSFCSV
jgi:hypothetical protein